MGWLARAHRSRYPLLASLSLGLLLLAGVVVALVSERALKEQSAREAGAQAGLLASAVSGALAFDDRQAAVDYVSAVRINPNVIAAAIYDADGRLVASFARTGESVPASFETHDRATVFSEGRLHVTRPVEEAGQRLGVVSLWLLDMPASQRLGRYAGLLVILGLAILVVVVLARAQAALRRANCELARRAEAVEQSNTLLREEMAERQKAEEALRQSQKMEAIGRLTGGIAHDFNNLLMVAASGINLLARTEDSAKRAKLSEGVRQAIERGAALTRQLLAFSRRAPLRSETIDLAQRIEGLRFLLERSLREDIEVVLEPAPDLWPVEVDPGELELALLNLCVNARDAMPKGGRITVSAENVLSKDGDHVCIRVTDQGVGMSPAVAARIFEPFFTTKEVGQGTGLGLSQVYGFVQASGGSVDVESAEGAGAIFSVCLPRATGTPGPAVTASTPAPAKPPARRRRGARVLLVEDDDAVADGVGHMLRDLGYAYARAPNARDALEKLEHDRAYDAVLSDMIMPGGMDGLGLAQRIRDTYPDLPVILMTGYSEAANAATREDFKLLLKPYGLDALSEALEQTLGG